MVTDILPEDDDGSSLLDVLGADTVGDVISRVATERRENTMTSHLSLSHSLSLSTSLAYLRTVTLPLLTGSSRTGSDTRIGLNWKRQPKQRAESEKKDTDTIGRAKMWSGSTCDTMQPPGW